MRVCGWFWANHFFVHMMCFNSGCILCTKVDAVAPTRHSLWRIGVISIQVPSEGVVVNCANVHDAIAYSVCFVPHQRLISHTAYIPKMWGEVHKTLHLIWNSKNLSECIILFCLEAVRYQKQPIEHRDVPGHCSSVHLTESSLPLSRSKIPLSIFFKETSQILNDLSPWLRFNVQINKQAQSSSTGENTLLFQGT